MKIIKPKFGVLLAAALMGLTQSAKAQSSAEVGQFVPLENLSPELRAFYEPKIRELEKSVVIDWNTLIAGVDEQGNLTLKDRASVNIGIVSSPTCWQLP